MNFRRRRRVNWLALTLILALCAGVGYLLAQNLGGSTALRDIPFFPKPTPTATPPVDDGSAALARGDTLFDQGRLDEAAEAYQATIAITEKAVADFSRIADQLAKAGNEAGAAVHRTEATKATQRMGVAYTRWCKILALRNRTTEAIARCTKALEINPRNAESQAFLALAYDRAGEYNQAIAAALKAIDLDATYAEAYAFLAEAYADKQPFEKRNLETALKAVSLNEKSAFAQRNLGWVHESEGRYRDAAVAYQKATELMPNLSYFYLDLGRVWRILKQYNQAISAFRKAGEVDPQNPEPSDKLGLIYYDQGEYDKAIAELQKAIQADPSYALAYGHLGWVYYFGLRGYERAVPNFEKALELGQGRLSSGTLAEFHVELGWSLFFLGRCSDARPNFDRALGLLAKTPDPTLIDQANRGLQACEGRR